MLLPKLEKDISWSCTEIAIKDIEEDYDGFPVIVKTASTTSNEYSLPMNCVTLLLSRQPFLRVVAHVLDKNCYVIGSQLEIPSTCNASLSLCNNLDRDGEILKTYNSVQEIANFNAKVVYVMEELTVTLRNDDKSGRFTTTSFCNREQLIVVNSTDEVSKSPNYSNTSSGSHESLTFYCKRLDKFVKLPYSLKGRFASSLPQLEGSADPTSPLSLHDIIKIGNFPLTVVVQSIFGYDQRSNGERCLHAGMRLKLLSLEEHEVILALDQTGAVREFTSDATFFLPEVLTTLLLNEAGVLANSNYVEILRQQMANLQPSDILRYCQSVRPYIPGTVKSTGRTRLNAAAALRDIQLAKYDVRKPKMPSQQSPTRHRNATLISNASSENSDDSMWGEFTLLTETNSESPHIYSNVTSSGNATDGADQNVMENGVSDHGKANEITEPTMESGVSFVSDQTSVKEPYPPTFPFPSNSTDLSHQNPADHHPTPSEETVPKELYSSGAAHPEMIITPASEHSPVTTSEAEDDFVQPKPSTESFCSLYSPESSEGSPVHSPTSVSCPDLPQNIIKTELETLSSNSVSFPRIRGLKETPKLLLPETSVNFPSSGYASKQAGESSRTPSTSFSGSFSDEMVHSIIYESGDDTDEPLLVKSENTPPADKAVVIEHEQELSEDPGNSKIASSTAASDKPISKEHQKSDMVKSAELQPVNSTSSISLFGIKSSSSQSNTKSLQLNSPLSRVKVHYKAGHKVDALTAQPNGKDFNSSFTSRCNVTKPDYVRPPPNWFPPDDVATLSVQEVTCSLRYIGIREGIVQFLRNERVDGSLLVMLPDEVLKRDCGFNSLQVLKLKQFIRGWRPNLTGCRV